ncbi:hypothetical protein ACUN7V_15695 [Quadrisphaera oryzae]|uniref:hypothetical protein n=1 Tax=Quadrisphaera TaxID=317661 RepID=UPI0016462565|nr:hypothetical protein [Quadrisphaera sp. RL12-1S]MBC3764189.1 hypothetical protein [Quadrisphaera sp. RL12-1S]
MARAANEHVIGERSVTYAAFARGRTAREALLPWFFAGVFVLSVPLGVLARSPELMLTGLVVAVVGVALFAAPFGVRPLHQRLLDVVRWRGLSRAGELRYSSASGFAGLEAGRHAPGRLPAAFGTITWRDVPFGDEDGDVCVFFQPSSASGATALSGAAGGHYGVCVQVDAAWGGLPDVLRHDRLRGELGRALGQLSDSFDRVAMYSVCSYADGTAGPAAPAPPAFREVADAAREDAADHPRYDHFLTLWATSGPALRAAARAARVRGESDPHLAAARVVADRLRAAVPLLEAAEVAVRRPLDAQLLAGVNRGLLDRSVSLWDPEPTDPSRMVPSLDVRPTHVGVLGRHGDGFLRGYEVTGFSDEAKSSVDLVPLHTLGAAVRGRVLEHVVAVVVDLRDRVSTLAEAHRHDQGEELRRQVRESTSHLRATLDRPADERRLNVSAAGGGWHGGYGAAFFVLNAPSLAELDDDGDALVAAARACGVHVAPVAPRRQDQAVVAGTLLGRGLARVL